MQKGTLTLEETGGSTETNGAKLNMSIELKAQPVVAAAKLTAEDVAALKSAITPLVSLSAGSPALTDMVALALNVQPDGTGVLNVRFK